MRIAFGVVLIVCANVNADVSQKPPPKSSNDETAKFDALYEDLFTVFKKVSERNSNMRASRKVTDLDFNIDRRKSPSLLDKLGEKLPARPSVSSQHHASPQAVHAAEYSYEANSHLGPSRWSLIDANCAGRQQSPINIITNIVRPAMAGTPLTIFNSDIRSESVDVINSGHGVNIHLGFSSDVKISLYGGPLKNPYIFENFHLHWPAEHTINGRSYDAELHIVSYNSIYGSYEKALAHPDGLAVLGMFFRIDSTKRSIHRFIDLSKKVRLPEASYSTTKSSRMFSLNDVIGSEPIKVYSYSGSLARPNCNEVITWMVSDRILKISPDELADLHEIRFSNGMKIISNSRPVQPLNGRAVTKF